MSSTLIIAFAAGLAAGSPSAAQDMAASSPPATAPASSEADINAAAQAFRTQVEAMNSEARAAAQAAGSNRRRAAARVDEVLVRYQPGFESFAVKLEAWFSERAAAATTAEERATIIETGAASVARVRGVPDQVRADLVEKMRRVTPERPEISSGM